MLFAAAGLPGVLAAAQGIQLQVPICGPGSMGTDLPTDPGPAAESHNDHCKIYPCGAAVSVGSREDASAWFRPDISSGRLHIAEQGLTVAFRAELVPLNGRAPPPAS